MRRWVLVLALALFAADTSGIVPLISMIITIDDCCDEATAPNCTPGCEHCTCCPHTRPIEFALAPVVSPPSIAPVKTWRSELRAPQIDPDEIFHIPKVIG